MNIVKIRILNEAHAIVLGLKLDHQEYFYEKYSFHVPNYFFNPKFKLGQWDGKIHFFKKTGQTYFYLLEDIIKRVSNLGYKIELEDLRTANVVTPPPIHCDMFKHIPHLDTGESTILRNYQVDAVNAVLPHGNGVIVAGTGAGKTLICSALIAAYNSYNIRSLTIVPNQDLIRQTKVEYMNCEFDTGEYSGTTKTLNHQHVVSTWQALKNNSQLVNQFDMIIVDECHGLRGQVLGQIVTEHAANIPYRFGVTGTLPKDKTDLWAVHMAVGPVRYEIPAFQLIDEGVLAQLQVNILQLEEDMVEEYQKFLLEENVGKPPTYIQFKDAYFPDFSSEKAYLYKNQNRLDWIATLISTKRENNLGNVLCLVDNITLGRELAARIDNAILVNGQDTKKAKDRLKIYNLFKEQNNLVVIATVHIVGTGLSINRIYNLFFIDFGKSFIRAIQGIGRGLRKAKDKDFVNILDICSDLKNSKKHVRDRIAFYKEAKYPHKKIKINYVNNSSINADIE